MKHAMILKTAQSVPITPEQLAKINAFSRRELSAEEVYVFSLVLCDNEIDRDYERFPVESLQVLAGLFVGKTGIFDHNPKGENQNSRIFETVVEHDPERLTQAGEGYCVLRAWAYMVRCDKNADLILEIDAGIKKEVSVSCAVERVECSICGANVREAPCSHEPGQEYNGVLCWRDLINPTDAYEWSFVAVPAQKKAGVTKGRIPGVDGELLKSLASGGSVTLNKAQAAALTNHLRELEQLAESGRTRLNELRRRMVKLAAFSMPELDARVLEEVAKNMDERQLTAFCKGFAKDAPPALQLGGVGESEKPDNGAFRI
ncbi:hypothetical protein [Anaerotruncus rubiinfantis]|uniref:hypothetical protein n=1 Tax=Anaerotruncus rubiinfantis TaxID=1720200 RepID=UPI00082EDF41|nr:hypothetical protein [Anaerotruncus rubiinfantis]